MMPFHSNELESAELCTVIENWASTSPSKSAEAKSGLATALHPQLALPQPSQIGQIRRTVRVKPSAHAPVNAVTTTTTTAAATPTPKTTAIPAATTLSPTTIASFPRTTAGTAASRTTEHPTAPAAMPAPATGAPHARAFTVAWRWRLPLDAASELISNVEKAQAQPSDAAIRVARQWRFSVGTAAELLANVEAQQTVGE